MTVSNEDILRAVLDNRSLEAGRYEIIMATMADFQKKHQEVLDLQSKVLAGQAQTDAALEASASEVAKNVAAGHASLLDQMMEALAAHEAGLTMCQTADAAMREKLEGLHAAIPTAPVI